MTLGRTFLALLIALSVALLPAAGGAAAIKPAASHATMVHGGDAAPSPCPDDGADNCTSLAACAIKCFAYSPGMTIPAASPPPPALPQPLRAGERVREHLGSPPFRPPRA